MPDLDETLVRLGKAAGDLALRQSPSPYAIALTDSIAHVREVDWDAVAGSRLFLGRTYLQALERAQPPRMSFRYAVLYRGPNPIAVAAYQLIAVALDAFASRAQPPPSQEDGGLRQTLRQVRRDLVRTVGDALGDTGAQRLLIGGNGLVTGEHGFAVAPGVDPASAIHGLADATYRIRRAEKLRGTVASVLIKDFFAPMRPAADELLRFGYHAFEIDPNMEIRLPPAWSTFEDYLGALSAKYRRKAKDVRKKAKALRVQVLSPNEVEQHAEALYALYGAVHDKAKLRLASPGPGYFPALAAAFGSDLVLRAYRLDDEIVGCSVALKSSTEFEAHMVGLNYEHNIPHGIYQSALYDFIVDGLAARVPCIAMGRTALEIKSALGAVPQAAVCYMRHSNPVGNRLMAPLIHQITPEPWEPRSPYKDAAVD